MSSQEVTINKEADNLVLLIPFALVRTSGASKDSQRSSEKNESMGYEVWRACCDGSHDLTATIKSNSTGSRDIDVVNKIFC